MVSRRVQKRIAFHRKLHILRTLTGSKSVKKSSIIMDAFYYINQLKLKAQALNKEYGNLMNQIQAPKEEVKVEKIEKGFVVRVSCEKGEDMLVSILAAIEDMGLNAVQARVSCNHAFCMEAIAEVVQDKALDVRNVTQTILKAIAKPDIGGEYLQA